MIKRGGESFALRGSAALDADPRQGLAPTAAGLGAHLVKIPAGNVLLQVAPRPLDAHEGDAGFQQHLFACRGGEFGKEPKWSPSISRQPSSTRAAATTLR